MDSMEVTDVNSVEVLSGTSNIYTSFKATDLEKKKLVYNAVANSLPLREAVGTVINLADVVAQNVTIDDMAHPGAKVKTVRVVLIDDEGRAYGSVSTGVLSSLENIFAIMGHPDTWTEPLPVIASERTGRKGYRFLTLELA